MIRLSLVSMIFCLASAAFAHEGGHGPAVPGIGTHGGLFTAVVAATDIDLEERAPVQGIAEWKVHNGVLSVWLLKSDRQSRALISSGELKWIVLFNDERAPLVEKIVLSQSVSELNRSVPDGAKTIEAIVSGFDGNPLKHVFAVSP